jgi:hypothetical protein
MFFGFNNKKKSSIGGDFDGDGIRNNKDCRPMNWKKQDECEVCGRAYRKAQLRKHNEKMICDDCYEEYKIAILSRKDGYYVDRWGDEV